MLSVDAIDLYYGASQALRRVSLTAKKGEVTCILGRNGVGKTSLLRAIFGLQPIRAGQIAWEDRELTGLCCRISAPVPAWRWCRRAARSFRA